MGLVSAREKERANGEGTFSIPLVQPAIDCYQQALAIAREIGDRSNEGNQLGNLGLAHWQLGQVEPARECLEQALVIFEEIKSPRAEWAQAQLARLAGGRG